MKQENNNERESEIKIVEAEMKELRDELISIAKEIKDCKDSSTRKALFADKKMIQSDIEEARKYLSLLKGEDVSMPSDELDELFAEIEQDKNDINNTNTEQDEQ